MERSFHDEEAPLHENSAGPGKLRGSSFARLRHVQRRAEDEAELQDFIRAVADVGVHIVCAAGLEGVTAAALVGKAIARARVAISGVTVSSYGERIDSPASRAWLADAPALVLVGLGMPGVLAADVAQFSIDGSDGEPLAARAFRLGEALAPLGDASWCAAVGLVGDAQPHVLVERALGRHARADLEAIAGLVDAAARGPEPAFESLNAVEMLMAAPDPGRFLESVPAEVLRRTQERVRVELARATLIRPRPGFGVVVVEYASACHIEDLVAERWRGLRPGTVVLVANHGAADGMVTVTARAAAPKAIHHRLGRLHAALGDEGAALLDPDSWSQLRDRLGVAATEIDRLDGDGPFELSALLN